MSDLVGSGLLIHISTGLQHQIVGMNFFQANACVCIKGVNGS